MLKKQILNIINQLLAYDNQNGVSDNPSLKSYDWTRRMTALPISNALSDSFSLYGNESKDLFSSVTSSPLDLTSVLSLSQVSGMASTYRLTVTAGTAGFRTARALSLTNCTVTVNNNAMAIFDFGSGTLGATQVGDVLRIKSQVNGDAGPYAFNPLNGGLWQIIGVQGSKISAVRQIGQAFQGVAETASAVGGDVSIYSAAGLKKGDKLRINSGFSQVSQKTFEIKDVTPTFIQFTSTAQLPAESGIANTADMITFFGSCKKVVYIEADQEVMVYLNGSNGSTIVPIQAGNATLPGFLNITGEIFSCSVTNKSINPLNIKLFTAE